MTDEIALERDIDEVLGRRRPLRPSWTSSRRPRATAGTPEDEDEESSKADVEDEHDDE